MNFSAAWYTRLRESVGRLGSLQVSLIPWLTRSNDIRSKRLIGCITVSNSWNPSTRLPRMFSSKLILQGDGFSKFIRASAMKSGKDEFHLVPLHSRKVQEGRGNAS